MLILVTGGSCSGKSAYGEKLAAEFSGEKYYLAAMKVQDEESRRRVKRHRAMRSGKGFITLEQPVDIHLADFPERKNKEGRTALLECMSNLTANEMFLPEGIRGKKETVDKIKKDVACLMKKTDNLVIITNNVFEDGCCYDKTTMDYLAALGEINRWLAGKAHLVYEVVAGIPVLLKEIPDLC